MKKSFHLRLFPILLLLGITLVFIYLSETRRNTYFFKSKSSTITLTFQNNGKSNQTLYFPPGSSPKLRSITFSNQGPGSIQAPYLVINEENRFSSIKDIIDSCASKYSAPQAAVLCLSNILSENLVHLSEEYLADDNENFPKSVLEALNYYGYSSCGPSSRYLIHLAQSLGLPACMVDLKTHVVAEIEANGKWMLLDPDRRFFYTSDDYRNLLSMEEFKSQKGWKTAPKGKGKNSSTIVKINTRDFHRKGERFCDVVDDEPFALADFSLYPTEKLHFDRTYNEELKGSVVSLTRLFNQKASRLVTLPYPALSVGFKPIDEKKDIKAEITLSGNKEIDVTDFDRKDLAGKTKVYSRITSFNLDLQSPKQVQLLARMRYAKNAFPALKEGINTFRFQHSNPEEDEDFTVDVELELETVRYERNFKLDELP